MDSVDIIYYLISYNRFSLLSVTAQSNALMGGFQVPAVYFRWDMSPITGTLFTNITEIILSGCYNLSKLFYDLYVNACFAVKFQHRRMAFSHFIVQVCAIIGGVFTALGMFKCLNTRMNDIHQIHPSHIT